MGKFFGKKGDEWVDWLSDEQPSGDVQAEITAKKAARARQQPIVVHPASSVTDDERRARLRRAGTYTPAASPPATKTSKKSGAVSIDINLPQLQLPKIKLPWPQIRYWSIRVVPVVVLLAGAWGVIGLVQNNKSDEKNDVQGTSTTRTEPSFKPLAPEKKPDLASANSGQAQYDGKRNLYTYNDNFSGANVIVSQQPLPEALKKDPAKVLQLTDSIGAKEKVTTAYGVVYFGFDEKAKVLRSVLLNTNQDRLVFLQSDKKFDAETLKFYIESLR